MTHHSHLSLKDLERLSFSKMELSDNHASSGIPVVRLSVIEFMNDFIK
tara:strand:- start:27 stop:170 length:144 start_codon:yes stop_codon:yes gene_type:complete